MIDASYIVFRCYSRKPIYTFSKSIISMINLLDSINNKGYYYLRHNLSQNLSQKKISSKSLDTFLKKLENQKVKDFEFICRLKDTDSNKVFPFRFQITYDNHMIYATEAFGRGGFRMKTLMPRGEFRIEVCIQSHLVPEDLFSKFETAFKELYISSDSSYGYWDIMDMRDALFSKRSIYERKLILDRGVARQYDQRVAGVFAGNFLIPSHMEIFKKNFPDIMEDCKYEELANGSFYLKLSKEQEEAIISNIKFDQILPMETEPYSNKKREAYILKPSHIEKLGGIDVIKRCLPDKASLVQYEDGLILIFKNEDRNDVNELVAFLFHIIPFKIYASIPISKNFADDLRIICTKEDKCNIYLCINMSESMSTIPFNLVNSKSNSEFCNVKKIIADWISSCGEEPQISYDEKNDILKWEMNPSSFDDIKIIRLYDLLNEYAVENKMFAYFNVGVFKEEGISIMKEMAKGGLFLAY